MPTPLPRAEGDALAARYAQVRGTTEGLCAPLAVEDFVVQSMPDVSPAKWHIAHVTWFFETFVLRRIDGYEPVHPAYEGLFNSYYNTVGEPFPRAQRGLLSRPTVAEVQAYRRAVDDAMAEAFATGRLDDEELRAVVELGLHHEQQHQELLLMDIKHVLSINPLYPAYGAAEPSRPGSVADMRWLAFPGGPCTIGADDSGFAFDNERPRHERLVQPFRLADRPVTAGEYLAFVEDGGYETPSLWLSDGWSLLASEGWREPLYWDLEDGRYFEFTLQGRRPLNLAAPVCHVSYYEADAYATWAGCRLPDEFEWEVAAVAGGRRATPPFRLHPASPPPGELFGEVWEWTRSAYQPYPSYRPPAGALGEYNGKFMCNQLVLRGGACVTPPGHVRATYRNFFYPHMRWQFGGIRLATDA